MLFVLNNEWWKRCLFLFLFLINTSFFPLGKKQNKRKTKQKKNLGESQNENLQRRTLKI